MTEFKRVLVDTAPIIYYLENSALYMDIEVVDIDSKIAEQAAKLRGQYKNFKPMDARQIATAIVSGCDMFFTNDKQLRLERELPCMTMDDLV